MAVSLPDSIHIHVKRLIQDVLSVVFCAGYIAEENVSPLRKKNVVFQECNVGTDLLAVSMGICILETRSRCISQPFGQIHQTLMAVPQSVSWFKLIHQHASPPKFCGINVFAD